jgi:hypothetical protein
MKNTILSLIILALILTFAPASSQGQTATPPGQFSYQGFLTDANGLPLATNNPINYTVTFRIYNAAANGVLLWAEQQVVTVDRGYFTVMLGNGTSVGPTSDLTSVFTGTNTVPSDASDRYLELTVNDLGSTPISPRLRLLPSPYAYLAITALNALNAVNALNVSAAGHVSDTSLSTNVALRNASQAFTGVNTFSNAVGISTANTLEFGAGVAGKEQNAGKIGYQKFTPGALDIVGAGTNAASRRIQFWAEGGANFTGDVKMQGGVGGNTVFAAGSQEDLRIVRGVVNSDGTIISGSGFTINHGGTGAYAIKFNQAFSDTPAVTVTIGRNSSNTFTPLYPIYYGAGLGEVDLYLLNSNGAFVTDASFHFIAVGAR